MEAPIEATAPEVLLDTDALSKKIEALVEADAAIRVCNRDLLTDGLDAARVSVAKRMGRYYAAARGTSTASPRIHR